ncbi:MAG: hypothetical protein ABF811_06955, partial [Pseudoclavibacter sp.]
MTAALDILRRTFGYAAFRGSQAEIIERVAAPGAAPGGVPPPGGQGGVGQRPARLRPRPGGAPPA